MPGWCCSQAVVACAGQWRLAPGQPAVPCRSPGRAPVFAGLRSDVTHVRLGDPTHMAGCSWVWQSLGDPYSTG